MKANRKKLISLIAAVACLVPWTGGSAAEVTPSYQLGAGDKIKVTVFGHEDLSGTFSVDDQGRVSLPLIQAINTQGLTQGELETAIANRLRPDYLVNPRVSVDVLSYRPFYIVGEVKNPGDFPYQADLTVLKAIAIAGGYSIRANKSKLYITRASDKTHSRKRVKGGARVYPGDIITIPERFF